MRLFILFALILTVGSTGCNKKQDQQAAADPLKGVNFDKPKVEPPPPPPQPMPEPKAFVKDKPPPKGLVQSVRAAAYRPMRLNELRQISLFMTQYWTENNKVPRNDDEFIGYIRRDAGSIAEAIKEKYYVLNLKVNMRDSTAIVAYESLRDGAGYQAARVDTSVAPVELDELPKQ